MWFFFDGLQNCSGGDKDFFFFGLQTKATFLGSWNDFPRIAIVGVYTDSCNVVSFTKNANITDQCSLHCFMVADHVECVFTAHLYGHNM